MPSCGFSGKDTHSRNSIVWLEYVAFTEDIEIVHARNGGEHRFRKPDGSGFYKVDGYCKETNTVYEYYGCTWHGCEICFPRADYAINPRHPHTGQSMSELFALTRWREKYLTQNMGFKLVVKWECQFLKEVVENEDLKIFSQTICVKQRLDPRHAFYGGRTNATKLYHEVQDGEMISYADITSLYPTVLKYDKFCVGIPKVILNPETTDIGQYFGIIYARVRAPRRLYHPVLAMRCEGKLFFPLCSKCARNEAKDSCKCANDVRDLEGTWSTIDLDHAVEKGYKVIKIYEVYHFEKTAQYCAARAEGGSGGGGGLFSEFVNTFLKGKQEASGYPRPDMTENEKKSYIDDYFKAEGIRLDPKKIACNSGLRTINKLMLNSFWGKFGEKSDHVKHTIVSEPQGLYSIWCNPQLLIRDLYAISETALSVAYKHRSDSNEEQAHVNVFIAVMTTSHARRRLHEVLDKLGRRVLYYDTDSVIYTHGREMHEYHPPYGNHLGQWTNELGEGEYITKFVSSGPKSYSYLTNLGRVDVKAKGITLSHDAAKQLNFDSIKDLVLSWCRNDDDDDDDDDDAQSKIVIRYPNKICRDPGNFRIYGRTECKTFRVTYSKRRVIKGTYDTLPYGY